MRSDYDTSATTHRLVVCVSGVQRDWLARAGNREKPRLGASDMIMRLVELAMSAGELEARRRDHQLEVFGASGYAEHHPDYPNLPEELSDAVGDTTPPSTGFAGGS